MNAADVKTCARCGQTFERGDLNIGSWKMKKYCSMDCGQAANRANAGERYRNVVAIHKRGSYAPAMPAPIPIEGLLETGDEEDIRKTAQAIILTRLDCKEPVLPADLAFTDWDGARRNRFYQEVRESWETKKQPHKKSDW